MASPIIKGAAGFCIGVYLLYDVPLLWLAYAAGTCLLLFFLLRLIRKSWNWGILFFSLFCLTGAGLANLRTDSTLHPLSPWTDHYITLTGRISELPYERDGLHHYIIESGCLNYAEKTYSVSGRVKLSCETAYQYGDTVECKGFLKGFDSRLNPSSFDSRTYYQSKGVYFRLYAMESTLASAPIKSHSVYTLANQARWKICDMIDQIYTGEEAALLKAILTGNKRELSPDFDALLLRTGLRRYLYPAYLHISLLTALLGAACAFLSKKKRDIVMLAAFLLYALANSNSPVFLKTFILAGLSLFFTRKTGLRSFPDFLALTLLILGFSNPLLLYDAGFVISLASGICIYLFLPRFLFLIKRYIKSQTFSRLLALWFTLNLTVSPLIAWFFSGIGLYSVFASLIMTPAVALILLVWPVWMLFYTCLGTPFLAGWLVKGILWFLQNFPFWLERLPHAYVLLPKPNLVFLLGFYTLLGCFHCYKKKLFRSRALLGFSIGFFLLFSLEQASRLDTQELSFINVGQGDATLIQMPFSTNILIDGGGSPVYSAYDVGKYELVPYLQDKSAFTIDLAFVSHYHKDHAAGILSAMDFVKIKDLFLPGCLPDNEYRVMIEEKARKTGTTIHYITHSGTLTLKNGLEIDVIYPDTDFRPSEDLNDTSLVMQVSYGAFTTLFTGDCTAPVEQYLAKNRRYAPAQVLKIPHHGSATSSSPVLLEQVRPKAALLGVGAENSYGLPAPEVMERYRQAEIPVFRTDTMGCITITGTKDGLKTVKYYKEGNTHGKK